MTGTTLDRPLTLKELRRIADENHEIKVVVRIDLDDLLDWDQEAFHDALIEKITQTYGLQDLQYAVVGHESDKTILLEVTADASDLIGKPYTGPAIEIDREYRLKDIEAFAFSNGWTLEFAGRDIYSDGESSQFLTLVDPDEYDDKMTFVWTGDADGAIYKRTT